MAGIDSVDSTNDPLCDLIREAEKFDFIRLVWSDIHGIQRGAHIPRSRIASVLQSGLGVEEVNIVHGPRSEDLLELPQKASYDDGNCYMKPVPGTLRHIPWSGEGMYKVGQVICESYWRNGAPQNAHPRLVARQQLQRLERMGYFMKSAFQVEFGLLDMKTQECVSNDTDAFSILGMKPFTASFLDLVANMETAGVSIERFNCGRNGGCFEVALPASPGIEAVDNLFIFKAGCKETMYNKGFTATFMTCPHGIPTNLLHPTFSIWDAEEGRNLFHDGTATDGISQMARWWLGGMIRHCPALKVLFCPTINCYRLRGDPFYPEKSKWAIGNRHVALRMGNDSPENTYIETRLTTSAANPYIVLAATVAAGLDGVVNKLEPPIQSDPNAFQLPESFEEAIKALEEDSVLIEAFGSEFIDWFLTCKKAIEMQKFKTHNVRENLAEEIRKEDEEYMVHI